MIWTLLVPGALVPAELAADLARALQAPALAQALGDAQRLPEDGQAPPAGGAPHWNWLGRHFGAGMPPITAPYAWAALHASGNGESAAWIAHCDPVHFEATREHVLACDFADKAPTPADLDELIGSAGRLIPTPGEALGGDLTGVTRAACAWAQGVNLRFRRVGDHVFALADVPVEINAPAWDALLGFPVHEKSVTGADARHWRALTSEIQMLWHTNPVNVRREEQGLATVNALWLHGGGAGPSPNALPCGIELKAEGPESLPLRGWIDSAATRGSSHGTSPEEVLSVDSGPFRPCAMQRWDEWIDAMRDLDARLSRELDDARSHGVERFELVLCGRNTCLTWQLRLAKPWWRRLGRPRDPARVLASCLRDGPQDESQGEGGA
jgi:hypothetical protein